MENSLSIFDQILETGVMEVLAEISRNLGIVASALSPAPELRRPLADYLTFDWSKIGARILAQDQDGPTIVEHNGRIYKRRAPDNKYGAAIWFSRADGKDAEGNNNYVSLISFEIFTQTVEPIGHKVREALAQYRKQAPRRQAPPPPPAAPRAESLPPPMIDPQAPLTPPARTPQPAGLAPKPSPAHLRVLQQLINRLKEHGGFNAQAYADEFKRCFDMPESDLSAENIQAVIAKASDLLNAAIKKGNQ